MSEEKKQVEAPSILKTRASANLQKSIEKDLEIEDPEEITEAFAKIIKESSD